MISVGIDVSKEKSTVCILRPYGEVVASPYEVAHTAPEVKSLTDRICSLEGEVRVVMEATGGYHLPLLAVLKQAGVFVSVINPLVMKKYASATLRKGKTDKLDAVRIANFGIDNWFKLTDYSAPEEVYAQLRMLGRQYSHYITIKIESKLALTDLLDRTMPGIKKLLSGKRSEEPTKDKLCDFVEEYWHYDNITKKSELRFISDYCRWAKKKGYHANETKARKIFAMARDGIPTLPSSAASTKMLTLEAVRVLREINRTLETILTQMQELATTLPEYEVVHAMKGVGDVLASRLIAEIGDARRFHSGSALVAFAGIDSPPYQSGGFMGTQRRISKRGSALLRKTGYEVMKCLKSTKPSQDAAVYLFMLKKEAEGKPKKVAKIAALNKFLRIYYARVMEVYRS
ncbi:MULTISPECIES: IS110 family RNA-guided transposase [Caproicibacterium]|uniref:IS110 family transposase n=1 Tax=Caproicibacterium argilliputei TaxID=3030016 RepID=A0AA97D5R2_9FIRM|nr:IS110 family transposase [Caproicibacterium argilliputei]WOC31085.1 IS110 family transposase [Caproicibacterium argilliputei]